MIWKLSEIQAELRALGENYAGPLCVDVLEELQLLLKGYNVSLMEFPIIPMKVSIEGVCDVFYWGASRDVELSSDESTSVIHKRTWWSLGEQVEGRSFQVKVSTTRTGVWSWLLASHEPLSHEVKDKVSELLKLRVPEFPEITLYPGPDFHLDIESFTKWRVHPDSNGMGVRLQSPELESSSVQLDSIESAPVFPGVVQWTPKGPIVLGPRCQSHGGYPRVYWLTPSDLARVIQYRPGEWMKWRLVASDGEITELPSNGMLGYKHH